MQNGRPADSLLTSCVKASLHISRLSEGIDQCSHQLPKLFSAIFAPGFYQLPGNEQPWVPNIAGMWSCRHVQFSHREKLCWGQQCLIHLPLINRSLCKLQAPAKLGDFFWRCSAWGLLQSLLASRLHVAPRALSFALSLERPYGIPRAGSVLAAATARSPWTDYTIYINSNVCVLFKMWFTVILNLFYQALENKEFNYLLFFSFQPFRVLKVNYFTQESFCCCCFNSSQVVAGS